MPAKIKLTDEERTDVVDLYAIGYSTPRVIDHLLSTHPDWQQAPRHQIKTAIRTCNPNHVKCSKKWKLRFEDTKRHFHKHREWRMYYLKDDSSSIRAKIMRIKTP